MLRTVAGAVFGTLRRGLIPRPAVAAVQRSYSGAHESDDQFDARWEAYFNRPDLDGWALRKGINDIQGVDLIPEPKIVIACLKACRRANDHSLAVRFLEALKAKCGGRVQEIYPWLLSEIRPTLNELGIATPEDLGYDKPELAVRSVYDMHGPDHK